MYNKQIDRKHLFKQIEIGNIFIYAFILPRLNYVIIRRNK
jgi:hypothetical protein